MGVNVQSFNETLETLKPQIDIMNGRQKSASDTVLCTYIY